MSSAIKDGTKRKNASKSKRYFFIFVSDDILIETVMIMIQSHFRIIEVLLEFFD